MSLLPGNFYLDDLFDDFAPMHRAPKMDFMKCDIYEKNGIVHIEMDAPGFEKKDINIDVEDGVLTIEANRNNEVVQEEKNYYRKERISGSFKRQFTIGDIDEDKVEASFINGVLEIKFPKEIKKESKKSIEIK